jgi:hypothetical protein
VPARCPDVASTRAAARRSRSRCRSRDTRSHNLLGLARPREHESVSRALRDDRPARQNRVEFVCAPFADRLFPGVERAACMGGPGVAPADVSGGLAGADLRFHLDEQGWRGVLQVTPMSVCPVAPRIRPDRTCPCCGHEPQRHRDRAEEHDGTGRLVVAFAARSRPRSQQRHKKRLRQSICRRTSDTRTGRSWIRSARKVDEIRRGCRTSNAVSLRLGELGGLVVATARPAQRARKALAASTAGVIDGWTGRVRRVAGSLRGPVPGGVRRRRPGRRARTRSGR